MMRLAFEVRCNGRLEAAFRTLAVAKQWAAQRHGLIAEPGEDLRYTVHHIVPGGKDWRLVQSFPEGER